MRSCSHWWQQSGNRMSGVVSGMSAICAAVLFAVVMNYLRSLSATAKAPQWLAFARSMGAAVTAVWLVTGAARAAIRHLVDVMDEPLPGTDVLRFATALNYTLLGLSGMGVLGLSILAVSVVVLRTDALGRWVGYVGVVCAVVILAAVVAQYGASRRRWQSSGRSASRSPSGVSRRAEPSRRCRGGMPRRRRSSPRACSSQDLRTLPPFCRSGALLRSATSESEDEP